MNKGVFISLEGGEGSGKSSQINLLRNWLDLIWPQPVIATREPGGTIGAEEIRQLLVTGNRDRWDTVVEALLMTASRRDNVVRLIKPALDRGEAIISDRFFDSTTVYQGIVGGVDADLVYTLNSLFLDDIKPDITLLLDIDPAIGLARVQSREGDENRFERKGMTFHQQVRQGYLDLAQKNDQRFIIINAYQDENQVHKDIVAALTPRIKAISGT
jgi:dTMP kinase